MRTKEEILKDIEDVNRDINDLKQAINHLDKKRFIFTEELNNLSTTEKKEYVKRIAAAQKDIIKKYRLEGFEDITGYKAALTLGISVQGGSRYITHNIPVEVPAFMGLEEVLEVFTKILTKGVKNRQVEVYLPKNEIEEMYMNSFWGKVGVKKV